MKKSIAVKPKRGRPATGRDPFVGIRLPSSLIEEIRTWSEKHETKSRSEAIRRLVELGLTVTPKASPSERLDAARVSASASKGQKLRAREMAGNEIDRMADATAHPDDQASRKHRLLKGPEEFRQARIDRPKAK